MGDDLDKPVRFLKGVGPKRAAALEALGIRTIRDVFAHLPRGYEDRSRIVRIADLKPGERATVRARVRSAALYRARSGRRVLEVEVEDASGRLTLVWFGAAHLGEQDFPAGREMFLSGRADTYRRRMQMVAPHFEDAQTDAEEEFFTTRILPEYPAAAGLSQTLLRRIVRQALDEAAHLAREAVPERLRTERRLPDIHRALLDVHFPQTMDAARAARRRMVYEEFLLMQVAHALRREGLRREAGIAFRISDRLNERFFALFPFRPTGAQARAIREVAEDMQRPHPMNRLLQGDVGSGKTMVALYPLLVAVANRYQAAIMAPTEVLAEQHYRRFNDTLRRGRVRTLLLRGGPSAAERRRNLEQVAAGEVDLVVGTQALIQRDVEFRRLGVVVVDEQHKFGVVQRHLLRTKGLQPDVLVMTATPIPRTLALTVFGDLDVSVLDEMPPGRRPVETRIVSPKELSRAYAFIAERLRAGEQAFVVYPLVEESEKVNVRAATQMLRRLSEGPLRGFGVGLLHGRMAAAQKERVMEDFRARRLDVLVATQVVEVGIDVPDATVMLVEHAERFGLAQLHQLRGRIGRGERPSVFLLSASPSNPEAQRRIEALAQSSDGFRIAEEDLRLRGPGEFFGTRQHGLPDLRVADIIEDHELLRIARQDAFALVAEDPALERPEHGALRRAVKERFGGRLDLVRVG